MITKHFFMALCDHCEAFEKGTNMTLSKFDKQTFIMNIVQRNNNTMRCVNKYSFGTVQTTTSIIFEEKTQSCLGALCCCCCCVCLCGSTRRDAEAKTWKQ